MESDTSDLQNLPGLDISEPCTSMNSPNSDNIPSTPSGQHICPTFLSSQQNPISADFLEAASNQHQYIGQSSISEMGADFDHIFGFNDSPLAGKEEDRTLARVFSQVLQSEMRTPSSCKCMKGSSAYSVILELAPHLRRALEVMRSFPEHSSSSSHNTCSYLNRLQDLNSSISYVIFSRILTSATKCLVVLL